MCQTPWPPPRKPMRLASAPPAGIPATVMTTLMMLLRPPEASAVNAMRLGNAPPRLNPHRKRITSRLGSPAAQAVHSCNAPNRAVASTRAFLRPQESAIRPPMKAPKKRPSGLASSTTPSCCLESPNSGPSEGAAIPIDCRSIPSITAVRKHSASVAIVRCSRPDSSVAVTFMVSGCVRSRYSNNQSYRRLDGFEMARPQFSSTQHENELAPVRNEVFGPLKADPFDDHRLEFALHRFEFPLRKREIPFIPVPNFHVHEPGLLDRSGTLFERSHVVGHPFDAKKLHHLSGVRPRPAPKPIARDEASTRP